MPLFDIATKSRPFFFHCVNKCNACYRSGHDLDLYRQIIALHRETDNLEKLLDQPDFIHLIHSTLVAWNMNQRAARLSSLDELERTIIQNQPVLFKLYKYKLQEVTEKTAVQISPALELAFGGLKVMRSKRRIVGVSKTLHFLLPDLVMPIDSTYTMPAIYGHNRYSSDLEKESKDFIHIFNATVKAVQRLNITHADVYSEGWNTSIPKLLDNALIGLDKLDPNELVVKN